MVTRGQERCLTVYSLAQFDALTAKLREASLTNKATRSYVRMLSSAPSTRHRTSRAASASRRSCVSTPASARTWW